MAKYDLGKVRRIAALLEQRDQIDAEIAKLAGDGMKRSAKPGPKRRLRVLQGKYAGMVRNLHGADREYAAKLRKEEGLATAVGWLEKFWREAKLIRATA